MPESAELGARLRSLRHDAWDGLTVTQRQLSSALGVSGALLSSWENGTAVPPEDRLYGYARFFATRRSLAGALPELIPAEDLTPDEERRRQALIDELVGLREVAINDNEPRVRDTGALGGKFWYFPDGQPITILCTPLSREQLGAVDVEGADDMARLPPATQYVVNPSHPNSVRNLGNGDIDAVLELVGHIRAENPTAEVKWLTYDRITLADQLTGHLVILGGGDAVFAPGNSSVHYFKDGLKIPVYPDLPDGGDPEFDGYFVVSVNEDGAATYGGSKNEVYRPRFIRDESDANRPRVRVRGAPQLEADIALIVRKPNPLNTTAKVTMLSGIFSRGTYGAVRAFTDEMFRSRNEQWLSSATKPDDFWVLVQVPVFAGERTITPDLGRASTRLRMSSA